MAGFRIETRLRPAYVELSPGNYCKVLFHCWSQESVIHPPSIRGAGYPGGTVSGIRAIVENEEGKVWKVEPKHLRFVPGEFDGYSWDDEEIKMSKVYVICKDIEHFDYKRHELVLVTPDEVLARRMIEELADHIDEEAAEHFGYSVTYSAEAVTLINGKEGWKHIREKYFERGDNNEETQT